MSETTGQILVRLLDEVMNGAPPAKLNKELQKAEEDLGTKIVALSID